MLEENSNSHHAASPSRPATVAAWIVAASIGMFVCAWPLIGPIVAANDDLKFIRGDAYSGTLWQNLREGWMSQVSFRPLENLAATLCDEQTLECRPVLLIQLAGFAALIVAMGRLVRRLVGPSSHLLALLIIWLGLSPATTVSLWQMDTCSQTWVAALGAWIGVVTIAGIDAARAARGIVHHVIVLTLLCAIAVNIKELFYGWSAGIGLAVMVVVGSLWRRERVAARSVMLLLLPITVLPAAHLMYRWWFAGLGLAGRAATSDLASGLGAVDESRYQVGLGFNVVVNASISLLGVFSNGPLHLVRDVAAPLMLRLMPLAALVATFVLLAAAGGLAILHRDPARRSTRRALLLAALAGLSSLSITLPMASVSELYGLGANAASGLLIVAALRSLWNPADQQEQTLCRIIAAGAAAVLLLVGVYGVASRAYHFRLTWDYARELNRAVLEHQRSIVPHEPGATSQLPARIYFSASCLSGRVHNQYIVPPILALGIDQTMNWMNREDPDRPVVFVGPTTPLPPRAIDRSIRCEELPPRRTW